MISLFSYFVTKCITSFGFIVHTLSVGKTHWPCISCSFSFARNKPPSWTLRLSPKYNIILPKSSCSSGASYSLSSTGYPKRTNFARERIARPTTRSRCQFPAHQCCSRKSYRSSSDCQTCIDGRRSGVKRNHLAQVGCQLCYSH